MADFVLVHGAWSGSHTWRKVRPLLWHAGHQAFTPSLTGIGERAHLTAPSVGLTTHTYDVANAIIYEDLHDVVLLGYSYGGRVVTGALEHIADRVAHLVYLDSAIPNDGDVGTGVGVPVAGASGAGVGTDWLIPVSHRPEEQFDDPAESAWTGERRSPMPLRTSTDPVRLLQPLETYPFTRTYIKATGEPRPPEGSAAWRAADRARSDPGWSYFEIDTNHLIPRNRPDELVSILTGLVG